MACMHIKGVTCTECGSASNPPGFSPGQGITVPYAPEYPTKHHPEYPTKHHVPDWETNRHMSCSHCYCKDVWIGSKAHDECCMCGHRKLKLTSTTNQWSIKAPNQS